MLERRAGALVVWGLFLGVVSIGVWFYGFGLSINDSGSENLVDYEVVGVIAIVLAVVSGLVVVLGLFGYVLRLAGLPRRQ